MVPTPTIVTSPSSSIVATLVLDDTYVTSPSPDFDNGFINGSVDEDIFVHYTAIKQDGYRTLSEGQTVEFNLVKTEKGLQAIPGLQPLMMFPIPSFG